MIDFNYLYATDFFNNTIHYRDFIFYDDFKELSLKIQVECFEFNKCQSLAKKYLNFLDNTPIYSYKFLKKIELPILTKAVLYSLYF